jgi:hypothetical protein
VDKYGRVRQVTHNNIIRRMRFTCCITKTTDARPEYVIHIAFRRKQRLRERVSMPCLCTAEVRTLSAMRVGSSIFRISGYQYHFVETRVKKKTTTLG